MLRGEVSAGDPRPCVTVLESLPGAPFAAALRRAQHAQAGRGVPRIRGDRGRG